MKTVLGIITDGKKILIGKLKVEQIEAFGGLEYVFPGGKVEEAETGIDAVIRELREETGLNTEVIAMIGSRVHPRTQKEIEYYHCKRVAGVESTESSDNNDIDSLIWVELKEISDYMPTLFPVVKEYLERIIREDEQLNKS